MYRWRKKRLQVSTSDKYTVLFVSQKIKEKCWDMAFWKPLPFVSPGEVEMGFRTDFISSVRSLVPRIIRSGYKHIFIWLFIFIFLPYSFLIKVVLIKNTFVTEI